MQQLRSPPVHRPGALMVGENLTRFAHRRDASNSGARSRPWLHSGRRTCIAGICNTSTIATATGKHFRITWVLRDSDPECDDRIGPRYLRRVWLFSTSGQLPHCGNFPSSTEGDSMKRFVQAAIGLTAVLGLAACAGKEPFPIGKGKGPPPPPPPIVRKG